MQPKLSIDCAVSILIRIAEASWSTETYRQFVTEDRFIYLYLGSA